MKEFVAVLNSRGIWKVSNCESKCTGLHKVTAGLNPLSVTKVITIILWTGRRDAPWVPPCQADEYRGSPNYAEVTSRLEDDGLHRQCSFMEDLWADVGAKISSKENRHACRLLRIVNATAVLETYVDGTGNHTEKR